MRRYYLGAGGTGVRTGNRHRKRGIERRVEEGEREIEGKLEGEWAGGEGEKRERRTEGQGCTR